MQAKNGILCGALMACLVLSACARGGKEPDLITLRSKSRSPDEFSILPTKPLTLPDDVTALPEPTPGGTNITDPTPEADAVAALGGNPEAVTPGQISGGSAALLAHATRFGRDANIRPTLAAEDLEYRRKHDGRLLERIFNVTVYFKAYSPMMLDQYAELERWRAAGVQTVGAPPPPAP